MKLFIEEYIDNSLDVYTVQLNLDCTLQCE